MIRSRIIRKSGGKLQWELSHVRNVRYNTYPYLGDFCGFYGDFNNDKHHIIESTPYEVTELFQPMMANPVETKTQTVQRLNAMSALPRLCSSLPTVATW